MRVTGSLMKIEHRSGDFTPDDAETDPATGKKTVIKYDFHVLHIWDGEAMREIRVPKDVDPDALGIVVGDPVDLDVSVPKGVRIFLTDKGTAALLAA